jgi:hypothetical protein
MAYTFGNKACVIIAETHMSQLQRHAEHLERCYVTGVGECVSYISVIFQHLCLSLPLRPATHAM